MTPEGRVKEKVDAILEQYKVYVFKPVQFGMGSDGLDYHCIVTPFNTPIPFFIETKRLQGVATLRQEALKEKLRKKYMCAVFHIDGPQGYRILEEWLARLHGKGKVNVG